MSSNGPLIHLSDVKKVFYTDEVETHALSGIHLDIKQGEYVSIAGPSGCGKSTLLSILGLLIPRQTESTFSTIILLRTCRFPSARESETGKSGSFSRASTSSAT